VPLAEDVRADICFNNAEGILGLRHTLAQPKAV
jgi:hypothetical protein